MAVLLVTPSTNITALIASASVNPGDVLLLEPGTYTQTVVINKNYIRLLATGCGVVFEGSNTLVNAFTLNNTIGVEIDGLEIQNYLGNGILILTGHANRVLGNLINQMGGWAVRVDSSSRNLVWKNKLFHAIDGVLLINGSTDNWVIGNLSQFNRDDGYETFLSNDSNNALICNTAANNANNGIEMFGSNNLAFNNILKDNEWGMWVTSTNDSIVLENEITGNAADGILSNMINGFFAGNTVACNGSDGITVNSSAGIVQDNKVIGNTQIGIDLTNTSSLNLVYDNKLVGNQVVNLVDNGTGNNLLSNVEKPYPDRCCPKNDCRPKRKKRYKCSGRKVVY